MITQEEKEDLMNILLEQLNKVQLCKITLTKYGNSYPGHMMLIDDIMGRIARNINLLSDKRYVNKTYDDMLLYIESEDVIIDGLANIIAKNSKFRFASKVNEFGEHMVSIPIKLSVYN